MMCPGCHWNMSFTEGLRQKFCHRCRELMMHKAFAAMMNTAGLSWDERQRQTERYQSMEVPEFEPFAWMIQGNWEELSAK